MIVKTDDIHYKNIVKAMVNTDIGASWMPSEYPDGLLPSEMPQAIFDLAQQSYNSGYDRGGQVGVANGYKRGKEDGIIEGIAQGKQAEYDKFWDAYQQNGNRTAYTYGFYGKGFDSTNFYPKYDITPKSSAAYIFYAWEQAANRLNLSQRLKDCGVVLDTSGATSLANAFSYTYITEIPTIDCTGLSTSNHSTLVFAYGYERLRKIEKIISKEGITFTSWFNNTNLEEVTFEGVIGGSGLDFRWSTRLNKASIESIITHLSDNTSGLSVTLSKTAVENAFTGGSEGDEWLNLTAPKNNWTIHLI